MRVRATLNEGREGGVKLNHLVPSNEAKRGKQPPPQGVGRGTFGRARTNIRISGIERDNAAPMKASESAREGRRRCSSPRHFRFSLNSVPLPPPRVTCDVAAYPP